MRSLSLLACLSALLCCAQEAPPALSCAGMEQFLRDANIGAQRSTPKGVTLPKRATLEDGKLKHDASIQTIDEKKARFESARGGVELNFRDYWGYDVAGYELAKMLGLNMVPPYVHRKVGGTDAALSWWVPNVLMDEADRMHHKQDPPNQDQWNKEMYVLRVFNELIYNTDNNLTNVLITKDWHIWMIDFTRAFRMQKTLRGPKNLVQCDRRMLARMRELNRPTLETLKPYLTNSEIEALLARRDKIVAFFEDAVAKKGEAEVLFDLPRSAEPCGAGL